MNHAPARQISGKVATHRLAPREAVDLDARRRGLGLILSGRRESETQFRTDTGLLLPVDSATDECKDATAFALRP